MVTYHLLALQQPVGPEFTSANSASVGGHCAVFVTAMLVTARNTILNWPLMSSFAFGDPDAAAGTQGGRGTHTDSQCCNDYCSHCIGATEAGETYCMAVSAHGCHPRAQQPRHALPEAATARRSRVASFCICRCLMQLCVRRKGPRDQPLQVLGCDGDSVYELKNSSSCASEKRKNQRPSRSHVTFCGMCTHDFYTHVHST